MAETFGRAGLVVTPIVGGASPASLFRIDAGRGRYLLRIEGAPGPLRVPTQYEAMRMASEAGLAPRLHHVDALAGLAIMDFIDPQPLHRYPGGREGLVAAMGAMVARLQALSPIPAFVDYPDMVGRLFAHVRRTGLFADGALDPHWQRLERIRASWERDPERLVSSHNDCHPGNFLFDGERLWLIDWESAYRNDRFVDIAILLDNVARTPALEEVLLQACFGRPLDEGERVRLGMARALTRLYFAGFFLSASAAGGPARTLDMGTLYLRGFMTGAAVPPMVDVSDDH